MWRSLKFNYRVIRRKLKHKLQLLKSYKELVLKGKEYHVREFYMEEYTAFRREKNSTLMIHMAIIFIGMI